VRASLRALPAAVQAANEVLLDRLRNDLEGMEEKQSIIRDRLTSITRPEQARKTDATLSDDQISATVPPTSAEVDDFNQSIERYRAAIQEMESQISQLKAGKQQ
jgi:phage shock protein A